MKVVHTIKDLQAEDVYKRQTQSIPVGEVYAKTNIGYVGKFTDEIFGTYQAGFLVQLNCPEGMTFPEAFKGDYNSGTGKMIADFNNVEESVHKNYTTIKDGETSIGNCQINIYLWYDSYFGDSLTACRLSMYESVSYTHLAPPLHVWIIRHWHGLQSY